MLHWSDEFLECAVDNSLPEDVDDADVDKMISAGMEDAIQDREKTLRGMLDELKKLIDENEEYSAGRHPLWYGSPVSN